MEANNILSTSQYGFRKGKSAIEAIDKLVRKVLESFENKTFAQATLADICKAFDCVDHNILLQILYDIGFRGPVLNFIKSYLLNRKQTVFNKGNWSKEALVMYGVPQGSVLGPLLFLLYINKLPEAVRALLSVVFVDDTNFLNIGSCLKELMELNEITLKDAAMWFEKHGFLMNDDKTQNIIFTLKQIPENSINFEVKSFVKLLGIYIDDSLTWGAHRDFLSAKLSKIIYLFRKLTCCIDDKYLRTAYFGYFQSVIRYGLILWGNCSRVNEILLLQKKVIRIINKSGYLDHCKPIFIKLQVQTVINLYIFDLAVYVLNNEKLMNSTHKHNYNTRNKENILIEQYRLSKSLNSHTVIAPKIFNKLQHLIIKYPAKNFKTKLYDWLLLNPFYSIKEFFCIKNISF